ncbi:MAG TPA: UDP-N-acetylmuramoyl-L-alanyl-D-glutamate--2,6-diaminopimelate ligase, partial [Cryomorphaceae bacterium]|nr:UDP-N-acetylmuramoyl-L-alanyl-D-glutamate--2,6-diaminopimelate ligase [Cryomorphaceae bacterium]
ASHSDRVILTSDNPRDEDPDVILQDMANGLNSDQESRTIQIIDRRQAIKSAVMLAEPGDVILLAGKGHEKYQEIKSVRLHFDDLEEIHLLIKS